MSKSTATDIAPQAEASEEKVRRFNLSSHLISLLWDEPFFAHILRPVTKVRTETIPTAGVLAKDGDIKMWWNPKFMAGLKDKKVKGLLKHEGYHLVFDHTTTRRMDPHIIHNYATDLAINGIIPENELPDGGLIPGKAFKPLTQEQKDQMGPEAVGRYQRVSDKIASFPVGKAAEWYFGQLMADDEIRQDIEEGNKVGGKSLAEALKDGDVSIDENGNLVDKDGNPVTLMPGATDDHDGWDEMSDEDRELIKGKIKQNLEEAVKRCDSSGQWGSVGAEMRAKLREMVSNEVDWRKLLRSAVGSKRRAGRDSSVRRLNRKYPGVHPGQRRPYTSAWAVYVDQSGSVGDDSLSLAFGELASLAKRTTFDVFYFDTSVDVDNGFTWKRGRRVVAQRTRCGGTCFAAPTKHANKNLDKYDGMIIITDGEAAAPPPSRCRRIWVLIPGRELLFPLPKGDILVKMTWPKKEAA